MASPFTGAPLSFFIYTSPSPSQEEEEQQQQIGSPTSVLPVSFFSSREQQQIQIGTPFTPLNAPKLINPSFSISPISSSSSSSADDDLRVPYTTDDDDDAVLQNLIHIIRSVMMKSNSPSSQTLTPAQRLFNSLDLVQKKITRQLDRIKQTPTFQMGVRDKKIKALMSMR